MNVTFGFTEELPYCPLDAEALPDPDGTWTGPARYKMATCIGYRPGNSEEIEFFESQDRRPDNFDKHQLLYIRDLLMKPQIIVAHNANYDLDIINGLLMSNLGPAAHLPVMKYVDTMGEWKWGGYRNTLKANCERWRDLGFANINLKTGSPAWRKIAKGDVDEWQVQKDYNINDVICTGQLKDLYNTHEAFVPLKIRTWKPNRIRR